MMSKTLFIGVNRQTGAMFCSLRPIHSFEYLLTPETILLFISRNESYFNCECSVILSYNIFNEICLKIKKKFNPLVK